MPECDLRVESGPALTKQMRSVQPTASMFDVPFEQCSERNELRSRADERLVRSTRSV